MLFQSMKTVMWVKFYALAAIVHHLPIAHDLEMIDISTIPRRLLSYVDLCHIGPNVMFTDVVGCNNALPNPAVSLSIFWKHAGTGLPRTCPQNTLNWTDTQIRNGTTWVRPEMHDVQTPTHTCTMFGKALKREAWSTIVVCRCPVSLSDLGK